MGRGRSSDSDSDYSRSKRKKKEKKKARSRSSSSGSSRHSSNRHNKSKKKHSSRKASPSPDRHRSHYRERSRRSRSRSSDRRTSRRSRSPQVSKRRSQSPSYSRDRRSRSESRGYRSKGHRQRSRSSSRGHDRSRSTSRHKRENSSTRYGSQERHKSDQTQGMTSSELAEIRMRKALQAAAIADKKLKGLGGHGSSSNGSSNGQGQDSPLIHTSSREFANSVATIESDSFVPSAFKSSRTNIKEEPVDPLMSSHDDAIFGSLSSMGFTIKPDLDNKPVAMDPDSIMHPSLFCNVEEKMEKWIERLSQLRRRKLEGDVMQ